MYRKNLFAVVLLLFASFVVASCTHGNAEEEASLSATTVQIVLSVPQNKTRATTVDPIGDESYLKDVRVLFFTKSASSEEWLLERNELKEVGADGNDTQAQKIFIENVLQQEIARRIYVVANWADYNESELIIGSTTEMNFLDNSITRISTPIKTPTQAVPLLMFGAILDHKFSTGKAVITLTRQVAKIQLTVKLSEDFKKTNLLDPAFRPGWSGDVADQTTQPIAHLQNIPNAAYIESTKKTFPTSYTLMEYSNLTPRSSAAEFLVEDAYYAYPNWVVGNGIEAKEKATTLQLNLPLKLADGTVLKENYYTVPIKSTIFGDDIYSIQSNYVYNVEVTINGFGEGGNPRPQYDLDVKITVSPWNIVPQIESQGDFVRFEKMTRASDEIILDGGNVSTDGESINLYCNTNVGEWYTVTRDANNNNVVHRNAPTSKVTNLERQSQVVAIPSTGGDTYKIEIYHPRLAPEAGGPLRVLTLHRVKGFVTFVKATNIDQYSRVRTIPEGGWLWEEQDAVTVHCRTNVGGWTVSYTTTDLNNSSKSVSSVGATSAVSSVEVQEFSISIPASSSYTEYTFKVIDKNSNTVATFTAVQSHGIIPNKVLRQSFYFNGTAIAGWVNGLKSKGLQVSLKSTEVQCIYGPAVHLPLPSTLGSGVSNTSTLAKKGGYIAAEKCNNLSMFLPTTLEWTLISNQHHTFSPNYQFSNAYWPCDQFNQWNCKAMYVGESPGSGGQTAKGSQSNLRCVKLF